MFFEKHVKNIQKLCRGKTRLSIPNLLSLVFFISGIIFLALGTLNQEIKNWFWPTLSIRNWFWNICFSRFHLDFITTISLMFGLASKFYSDDLNIHNEDMNQTNKKTSVK